ncbi:hypothetical protein ACFYXS_22055 [Streptomyces sp. NPDC002574]|uniref:hypothetical protein n=1 Tax=Streptomyces sp. NPDC002574 TaxID=3364652 RepID=UPI0036C6ED69
MPERHGKPPGDGGSPARRDPRARDVPEGRGGSAPTGEVDELLRYEHEHGDRPAVLRMLRARRERLRGECGRHDEHSEHGGHDQHGTGGGPVTP